MGDVLGYAQVSTGGQDVAGQELRLRQAGAIKMFTDVRSGRSMDRPGLTPCSSTRAAATPWPSCGSTGSGGRSPSCSPPSPC